MTLDEYHIFEQETNKKYLKKSAKVFKVSCGMIIFSFIIYLLGSFVIFPLMNEAKPFDETDEALGEKLIYILSLLVELPVLGIFVLTPLGLYYSWKSYQLKEGYAAVRLRYLLGHGFFSLLIILFLSAINFDLGKLLII